MAVCGSAYADWTLEYRGADAIGVLSINDSSNSNMRRATTDTFELPRGRLKEMLDPVVRDALAGCSLDDVRQIVIEPMASVDHLGETVTRLSGLGLYLSLSETGKQNRMIPFIAPFFSLAVSLKDESGKTLQSVDLMEFNKVLLPDTAQISPSKFLDVKTSILEVTLAKFVQARLPDALHKAAARRCPQPGNSRQ